MYRVGRGLTPFPLGQFQVPWFCHVLPRISHARVYSPQAEFPQHGTRDPVFIYTGYSLCSFPGWTTHHLFLSMVINCEADNMYTTKIEPFLPTFQQLINPSLVALISLFFLPVICTICPVV